MTIIKYRSYQSIDIEFDDNTITKNKSYDSFKSGKVKNYNHPSVYGVGYIGNGKYDIQKHIGAYNTWYSMMKRCYSLNYQKDKPSYIDCEVCEEWHNFQNFANWYELNYYELDDEKMHLDKDILVKGNRTYSPDTCIFAPESINGIFKKKDVSRGKLPIGVNRDLGRNKYRSSIAKWGETIHLYSHDTPEEAFQTYKKEKEKYIGEVANIYKNKIPRKLYDALMNYKVEITD